MTARTDGAATRLGRRAVVLGASMAGLITARVLADRFDEVVLLERDELPSGALSRKGTPHAVHPHGLLARGREVLESLFPGLTEALVRSGAVLSDRPGQLQLVAGRRRFMYGPHYLQALCVSRLALEAEIRRRVLDLTQVRVHTGVDVLEPVYTAARGAVTGARLVDRQTGRDTTLTADFVVDCTGRGSRTPAWYSAWGYEPPPEESVPVTLRYVSAYFERTAATRDLPVGMICSATPDHPRTAVLIAQEPAADAPARWVVAVGGYAGDYCDPTPDALAARLAEMPCPELQAVLARERPIGGVLRYQFPGSVRRRYERIARVPEGFAALGDALTSFNPVYGQGMTTAACEAVALGEALDAGLAGAPTRFYAAAARVIDTPWQLAVGADLDLPAVGARRGPAQRIVSRYMRALRAAATQDPQVAMAFTRVVHLLEAPASLFTPWVVARVLRGALRSVALPA